MAGATREGTEACIPSLAMDFQGWNTILVPQIFGITSDLATSEAVFILFYLTNMAFVMEILNA